MRIGILTFHNADNFGCVLQCFALQEEIRKIKPDAEVEIINFDRNPEASISQLSYKDEEQRIHAEKFREFREKYINIYGKLTGNVNELESDRYDMCIVGSDQVWNYNLIYGREKAYFLSFTNPKTRRISYAASLGSVVDDDKKKDWLQQWLPKMNSISLRESSALEKVRAITDKKIYQCIDPTLLHGKDFWEKLERKPEHLGNEKYVLMYALGYSWCREEESKAAELASDIAREKGLKVIHYYYGKLKEWFPNGSDHCYCEGPQELLWLFHHAEYVVCCSFHGTAFSVIYERPFYTFHTPGNGSRMKDFVSMIGLSERYIDSKLSLDCINWDIKWDNAQDQLTALRNDSVGYLKQEMNYLREEK